MRVRKAFRVQTRVDERVTFFKTVVGCTRKSTLIRPRVRPQDGHKIADKTFGTRLFVKFTTDSRHHAPLPENTQGRSGFGIVVL